VYFHSYRFCLKSSFCNIRTFTYFFNFYEFICETAGKKSWIEEMPDSPVNWTTVSSRRLTSDQGFAFDCSCTRQPSVIRRSSRSLGAWRQAAVHVLPVRRRSSASGWPTRSSGPTLRYGQREFSSYDTRQSRRRQPRTERVRQSRKTRPADIPMHFTPRPQSQFQALFCFYRARLIVAGNA